MHWQSSAVSVVFMQHEGVLASQCAEPLHVLVFDRSSRSHAIFTITVEMRRQVAATAPTAGATAAGTSPSGQGEWVVNQANQTDW